MFVGLVAMMVLIVIGVYIVTVHSLLLAGVPLYYRGQEYTANDYISALPFCIVYIVLAGRVVGMW